MNKQSRKAVSFGLYLILAYIAIYIVWGTTFLANLYALKGFGAFQLSGFRFIAAGFILLLLTPFKTLRRPSQGELKVLSISGILMLVGGSGLVVYAEEYIPSGYTAVLVATEPLWFVLLDRGNWKQYFSNSLVIPGLMLGFLGMVLFIYHTPGSQNTMDGGNMLKGTCIALFSSVLWVIGALYAKNKLEPAKGTGFRTCIQLFAAGLFAFTLATIRGEWTGFSLENIPWDAWTGLIYLIVCGSVIAFVAFNWLITVQPPALVSTHTFINPVIAIFAGWFIAGEPVASMQILALMVVLSGILLAQLKRKQLKA